MDVIGIIAEYNPFHNGHLYHINKRKEMYPNSIIVAVISSCFTEKGDVSVLNKWDKTKICLDNNIDIVVELPFVFSSQSADIFSYGALKILNELHVNKIVFGSESNDVDKLTCLAKEQINNKEYDLKVKKYLDEGFNYPTALSKALSSNVNTPNDILGICYIKEILKNNYNITPITIKRTNDFHSKTIKNNIISATAIRCLIKDNKDIKKYVPKEVVNYIYKNTDIYDFLKYKIISDCKILNTYKTVDEGIENRILKYIDRSKTIDELISNIKTKRYTYNKISRMFIHILTSFTKEESKNIDISYVRILGFNKKGKDYLNKIKKDMAIPLITGYKKNNDKVLDIEYRVTKIYSIITNDDSLIFKELKKPIMNEMHPCE
ncbi:MAG: nucleotidyltransferase [bacterium]|nr:nucleotidyltransferase [bacterium]